CARFNYYGISFAMDYW
nr:immunoglobulin heavy chain junction region [Mus musculus]